MSTESVKMRMTRHERVIAAMEFQPADRPPVVGGFVRHPAFLSQVAGVTVEQFWREPRKTAIRAFNLLGADCIVQLILPAADNPSGGAGHVADQTQFESPEAVVTWVDALPALQFDPVAFGEGYIRHGRDGQEEMGEMLYIRNNFGCAPCFQWETFFGAENYYMAIALYPQAMKRLFDREGRRARMENEVIARVVREWDMPRYFWVGQDACDDRGPIVGVAAMDELYFPALRYAIEPLVDAGIRIVWHSDGYITPIVPQLLAAGIEGFQGMQENVGHAVDLAWLCDQRTLTGRKPILIGSVSSTTTLPFGTPEDVRRDVRRMKDLAHRRGGGILINSSSSVGPEVSEVNVRSLFEEATTV